MALVSDMLAPRISEAAMDLAHRMRMLMGQDLDEFELAESIENENASINRDQPLFQEAWLVLSSAERSAWKAWATWRHEHGR